MQVVDGVEMLAHQRDEFKVVVVVEVVVVWEVKGEAAEDAPQHSSGRSSHGLASDEVITSPSPILLLSYILCPYSNLTFL